MFKLLPPKPEVFSYIKEKLFAVSQEHNIKILIALESGSRAWGFPSQDSDYDVRFIYIRPIEHYLSIKTYRDVIETPIQQDSYLDAPFDLNGWDIRKALQLALKSNAVLTEWIASPIRYMCDQDAVQKIHDFTSSSTNINSFAYHYNCLARNAWQQIETSDDNPRLKLYCYAIRPALALAWIYSLGTPPPMNITHICSKLEISQQVITEIQKLINIKAVANEGDCFSRNRILDDFIKKILERKVVNSGNYETDFSLQNNADQLFRNLLGS